MKRILQIASAFIGIVVGAGFASGQEILQYFTSFGYIGTIGSIVSTGLFAYLGMTLTRLGSKYQTTSHREVIYLMSGRFLGTMVDYIIVFTLFGVGVVMIAGAGSIFSQQFGLSSFAGITVMTILVILTVMMNVNRVIAVIASITPFLILTVILLSIYSMMTMDTSFAAMEPIARNQPAALSNWFISAVNYVSFNIALGAPMALVMGGSEKNERIATIGGLLGGLGIGLLIVFNHLAIFSNMEAVVGYEMPILKIADDLSPILGMLYSIILFGMIFNTAVSMFFSFGSRFMKSETKSFRMFIVFTILTAFALSFVGFTELVSFFYPLIGYLGLFLIAVLIIVPFRLHKKKNGNAQVENN
ncbi:hypothetical protein GT022_02695 [Agaribacter marinus]|uniref:Membrane protein YkvI n=1 Tax=Virgibacillus salarius TaxID=447199 RepID=A0A941DT81_9BACI|nr:hypothetical protein [Virgibacillus salarius]MBR7794951.1 hypothetical protein [Virgibacillus salarius]NAZ07671.1 hypothetical protein [Agaribacter marinus]